MYKRNKKRSAMVACNVWSKMTEFMSHVFAQQPAQSLDTHPSAPAGRLAFGRAAARYPVSPNRREK